MDINMDVYSMRKPLAIIEMGTPPESVINDVGYQSRWFIEALDLKEHEFVIVRPEVGELLPELTLLSGAIISGSWSMVSDKLGWSETVAAWICAAFTAKFPLFGVCYGHQLMAYALGGVVDYNPLGKEQGLKTISLINESDDVLLHNVSASFPAWLCHSQTVLEPPISATVLASSTQDSHQILRYSHCSYSVQFHPEFTHKTMAACFLVDDLPEQAHSLNHSMQPHWPMLILRRFYHQICLGSETPFEQASE
jgi:GMP synthase (glutamine-hydrolysing)